MAAKKDDFIVKKICPKLGGERGTGKRYGPTSSHDLVEQMEFLYVDVIKAIDHSPTTPVAFPIVEITLGNYKSSTATLPTRPNCEWFQVFAFDKSKGDVLSVTLKDAQTIPNAVVGKQNFKLSTDISTRLPPDARLAPRWYSIRNTETGHHMDLLLSVWFGTQADEVYSEAWFSDACDVSASCVINTRSKLYVAPRLCYVWMTIISGHDLMSNDGERPPSVYVTATLGKFALKTEVVSGSNPSWNRDLILVASEPFDDTVYFKLMDRVDAQHEECIGLLKKKLSEMTPIKVPGGSAPALFYDIEPAVKVEPAGDTRRFATRLKMKLAMEQSYHVTDECSLHSSDYRPFVKALWGGKLGTLEIGILSASGLPLMKDWNDDRSSTDPYVVAKYGNKWARTRTVINSVSPKWNEQYSWDVYERCTVVTLGVYDNCHIVRSVDDKTNDVPIGKVRIPLNMLEWDTLYTNSYPLVGLGKQGLKKKGEINLAVRLVCCADINARITAPFRWMLPKSHYKSPLSLLQIEDLRAKAVQVNCMNLAKTEPPLRNEVVMDMMKPESKNFSMRKLKADWERICSLGTDSPFCLWMYIVFSWLNTSIRVTEHPVPKLAVLLFAELVVTCVTNETASDVIIWLLSWWVIPLYGCFVIYVVWELYKRLRRYCCKMMKRTEPPPPMILLVDVKLSKLETPNLDELAEEFDTSFPSSEFDVDVLKMRYDRLRKMAAKVTSLIGDIASLGERFVSLLSYLSDPFHLVCFVFLVGHALVIVPVQIWVLFILVPHLNFKQRRISLPFGILNFIRRLPSKAHLRL